MVCHLRQNSLLKQDLIHNLPDPDAPDYADPPKAAATKSIFKPMTFVRAGESAPAPAPAPSMKKLDSKVEDSDDEEDVCIMRKASKKKLDLIRQFT